MVTLPAESLKPVLWYYVNRQPIPSISLPTFEGNSVPEINLPEIQKGKGSPFPVTQATAQACDEPVVTRLELWSYYCVYHYISLHGIFQRH